MRRITLSANVFFATCLFSMYMCADKFYDKKKKTAALISCSSFFNYPFFVCTDQTSEYAEYL